MVGTHRLRTVLLLHSALIVCVPFSAVGKSPCGVDGARVLLDFDVMHPPMTVLHLGTRLDVRVINDGAIVLDVRNRQTGEPIFAESPHGKSFYEVDPWEARHEQDAEKVRILETWIYAVILYIDYRDVRVTTGDHGEDEFESGRVRVCLKGTPN